MGEQTDGMRQRADWMVGVDDSLLELMRDDGNQSALSASREGEVSRIDIGKGYAGDRFRKLTEYGLVERYDWGLYRLTELGVQYLDEVLDASTLEPVD